MSHEKEKKIFASFLKRKGLKQTAQREEILETFLSQEKHLIAEELYIILRKRNQALGYATVYRTLKLLCEANLANEINLGDNSVHYEHKYGHDKHEHVVCVNCGKAVEFKMPEMEAVKKRIEKEHGFKLTRHSLKLFGFCRKCREDMQ